MDPVFALLAELKEDTLREITSPADDKRSEFHYGRVHGILFAVALIEQELGNLIEASARAQERREREF